MVPWNLVRLEHAPTGEFPAGSPVRVYFLHLPIDTGGHIDPEAHAASPGKATMRRFWPNEQDLSGHVVRDHKCWRLIVAQHGLKTSNIGWFDDCRFAIGEIVEVSEIGNGVTPYEVVAIRPA